jgi:peptidoglycan lytic transglycosylase G
MKDRGSVAIEGRSLPGRKRRRRSLIPLLFTAGLVILACLSLGIISAGVFELRGWAGDTFGPPALGLSFPHQLRLSALLLLSQDRLTKPANPLAGQQPFQVELGESPISVAARLQDQGIIPDAQAFTTFLQYSGLDTTIQAGQYSLSPALPPIEIARALQDATPKEVTLSVLEGWRLEEIAETIATTGLEFDGQEFLREVESPRSGYTFLEDLPPGNSLEGLLSPGIYRLPRESTVDEVVSRLLDEFAASLTPELLSGFEQQGLSMYEAITLASIVEREAIIKDEMPLIASVLLNRLAVGMRLEADSTVQYALGFNQNQNTWWTNPLSSQDLQIDSAYNTYRYPGLPPGPIANPGVSALRAVAFPATTPYYYFRAACDDSGKHNFSETYEEHLNNACP